MKKYISTLVVLSLSMISLAQADLKIPRSVFTMKELGEAKEKAEKDSEPLIFVYTDPGSS